MRLIFALSALSLLASPSRLRRNVATPSGSLLSARICLPSLQNAAMRRAILQGANDRGPNGAQG